MQWAAFEPNNQLLRLAIVAKLGSLLSGLWRQGALKGAKAKDAYSIVCDQTNNSQNDVDNGRLKAEIGLAITEPGEFIWLTYQRRADQSSLGVS